MAWLAGFGNGKRFGITIDSDLIDGALTNFPIYIHVHATAGIGARDLTELFDDLSVDTNRLKIAVTTSDGETQCYVEIAHYDWSGESMGLHIKVPSVLAAVDTVLYLYWDPTASDNTTYVGDTGDAVAQNVWDANYEAVWHLAAQGDGTEDEFLDSTDSVLHGECTEGAGTYPTYGTAGPMGVSQSFDSGDIINCGKITSYGAKTIECLIQVDLTYQMAIDTGAASSGYHGSGIGTYSAEEFRANSARGNVGNLRFDVRGGSTTMVDATWRHGVLTWDGTTDADKAITYLNGAEEDTGTAASTETEAGTNPSTSIGGYYYDGAYYPVFDGQLSEIRFSDTDRSPEWIKATYHTLFDTLITYGAAEAVDGVMGGFGMQFGQNIYGAD